MTLEEIGTKMDELKARSDALVESANKATSNEDVKSFQAVIENEIKPQLADLTRARDEELRKEEVKALTATVGTLGAAIEELRGGFPVGSEGKGAGITASNNPYESGGAQLLFRHSLSEQGSLGRLRASDEGHRRSERRRQGDGRGHGLSGRLPCPDSDRTSDS
jgi:hypothetical protein